MPVKRQKVLKARKAVEAYREAHHLLHLEPWHSGIPEEHTPLLNILLSDLGKQGFNSLQEFFDASETLGDGWR